MTLQELDERAMETIVDFFYSGEIEISENNVQDLLPVTCVLQVQSVQEACCEFLKRQLSSENCLGKLISSTYLYTCSFSCKFIMIEKKLEDSINYNVQC